jgi:tetratricopeptide (TPR) repeat protein
MDCVDRICKQHEYARYNEIFKGVFNSLKKQPKGHPFRSGLYLLLGKLLCYLPAWFYLQEGLKPTAEILFARAEPYYRRALKLAEDGYGFGSWEARNCRLAILDMLLMRYADEHTAPIEQFINLQVARATEHFNGSAIGAALIKLEFLRWVETCITFSQGNIKAFGGMMQQESTRPHYKWDWTEQAKNMAEEIFPVLEQGARDGITRSYWAGMVAQICGRYYHNVHRYAEAIDWYQKAQRLFPGGYDGIVALSQEIGKCHQAQLPPS